MNEDSITLGAAERRRLDVLTDLGSGRLLNHEAAELLGISIRQLQRLHAAFRRRGAAALIHGNRGRRPVNALDSELARKVLELAGDRYVGFNQHHLAEMLSEREGIDVSRPTLQRMLAVAGLAPPRTRRPPKHRQRRDRYPREGMLLQLDASPHDWLEGRGPRLSLVGAIDDATSMVPWGVFRDHEDAQGYFELMREVTVRHGVPMAVYSDRHSIFWMTKNKELSHEEQLAGRRRPTQFGRLLNELGVEQILANSPQAKGRVGRLWGTFQDRLTSELRLAHATTKVQAQDILVDMLPRILVMAEAAAESDPRLADMREAGYRSRRAEIRLLARALAKRLVPEGAPVGYPTDVMHALTAASNFAMLTSECGWSH